MKYLTQDEVTRLIAAASQAIRDKAILTVAYYRGLRASEVGRLRLTDLRQDGKRLFVHRLKHGNSGEYLLSSDEVTALKKWLRIRPTNKGPYLFPGNNQKGISRKTLHEMVHAYATLAGIDPTRVRFHALRHSIATHLLDADEDPATVQDWLGHVNIANTMVYAKVRSARRDRAAKRFYERSTREAQ